MLTPRELPQWRLLAATATLLGAVACGGGTPTGPQTLPPAPVDLASPPSLVAAPTETPASTPAGTPTMDGATHPSARRQQADLAAATAVVRRYYAVLNNLRHDMDPAALAALFTARCFCQQQVRAVRRAAARHEHYTDHEHLRAVTPHRDSPAVIDVLVDFDASRGGLVTAAGRRVTAGRAEQDVERDFLLRRRGDQWRIAGITVV